MWLVVVMQFNLGRDSEARFGRDSEARFFPRFLSLSFVVMLMFG